MPRLIRLPSPLDIPTARKIQLSIAPIIASGQRRMASTLRMRDTLRFPSDPAPTPLMEMYPISPRARYIANAVSNLLTVENLSGQVPRACKRKLSFGTAASHPFE
jgi:hypothetical protein